MYGKIFDSMYDGTLYGQWEAIVTFQQMIVLCNADGMVDMTPPAISARTSIPLEIITKGLEVLAKPDPYSRTPGSDGKRIELIDSHRPWGWAIINHARYKSLQDADTLRAQTRERVKKHRELKRVVTDGNGSKRHADADADADSNAIKTKTRAKARSVCPEDFGTAFSPTMQKWLADVTQVKAHLIHFLGYVKANGKTYVDWEQAFQNAIRDDWAGIRKVTQ